MNQSSMISKRLCAFFVAFIVMSSTAALPVLALGAETGSITIKPQNNNQMVEGCTFKLYQVAVCSSSSAPVFTLTTDFQDAEVDINDVAVSHAADRETAVEAFLKLAADSRVCTDTAANGSNEFKGLDLGAYLVVQDSAPAGYQYASEFLVFLPSTDADGRLITAIDASPKLDNHVNPIPGGDVTAVNVMKKWEDIEDANRPPSVKAALYNNDVMVETVELNKANNWSHSWDKLDAGAWKVKEINVPVGYAEAVLESEVVDGVITFTISNTKAAVPIDGELTVTKVWVNDKSPSRPTKVEITLFCNGDPYDVAELNADNGWIHKWTELNENDRWSVAETSSHSAYTVTVSAAEGGYIVYNTCNNGDKPVKPYSNGGDDGRSIYKTHQTPPTDTSTTALSEPEITIISEAPPFAPVPQTGLLQWPVPVLMVSGAGLIVLGYKTDKKRQYA